MKKKISAFIVLTCLFSSELFAVGEISVQNVRLQDKPPFQYKVRGTVVNETAQDREVVLRAQVVMYDQTAPQGDLPVRVLRKDKTIILKASESREVEMTVIQEGRMPDVRFRAEPVLRVRRQRLWIINYEDLQARDEKAKK